MARRRGAPVARYRASIIRVLEAEGHRPKRGERWHPVTEQRVIRSDTCRRPRVSGQYRRTDSSASGSRITPSMSGGQSSTEPPRTHKPNDRPGEPEQLQDGRFPQCPVVKSDGHRCLLNVEHIDAVTLFGERVIGLTLRHPVLREAHVSGTPQSLHNCTAGTSRVVRHRQVLQRSSDVGKHIHRERKASDRARVNGWASPLGRSRFATDAVVVPIKAVRVSADDLESPVSDVSTVEVWRWRRDAHTGVGRVAVPWCCGRRGRCPGGRGGRRRRPRGGGACRRSPGRRCRRRDAAHSPRLALRASSWRPRNISAWATLGGTVSVWTYPCFTNSVLTNMASSIRYTYASVRPKPFFRSTSYDNRTRVACVTASFVPSPARAARNTATTPIASSRLPGFPPVS